MGFGLVLRKYIQNNTTIQGAYMRKYQRKVLMITMELGSQN